MKRPKKLKYPQKPKASASAETMKKYLYRVAEVDRENKKRFAEYESEKKKRKDLRKKVLGVKS